MSVNPTSNSAISNKHEPVLQYGSKRNTIATRGNSISLWCIVGGT